MKLQLLPAILLTAALTLGGCGSGAGTSSNGNGGGTGAPVDHPLDIAPAVDGDPMGVVIHRLDNGLTVMISENHNEPRFTAWISARTGSAKDPADATGLAHYLEHMLFKGTSRLGTVDWEQEKPHLDAINELYDQLFGTTDPEARAKIFAQIDEHSVAASQFSVPNEFDKLYDTWGARGLNAFTSTDQTSYTVDLPSNRLESWAMLEDERFSNPVFRIFQTELETVYEEKNRAMDNKGRVVYEAMSQGLYPEHPYGTQTTIGTVEHLKNPSIRKMYEYFHTWYVPRNMVSCYRANCTARVSRTTLTLILPWKLTSFSRARAIFFDSAKASWSVTAVASRITRSSLPALTA